jgi:hypothetical protein
MAEEPMHSDTPVPAGFTPKFPYDLDSGSARNFEPILEKYEEWHKADGVGKLKDRIGRQVGHRHHLSAGPVGETAKGAGQLGDQVEG